MKREEHRHTIIPRTDTLPKGEQGPCMSGILDLDLYNRTGEIEMLKPLTEFVPPVVDAEGVHPPNQKAWRRGADLMNAKKPSKEVLEGHLRNGMTADEIGKKYDTTRATVYNWIRSYQLQGLKGQRKPKEKVQESPSADDMVQHSPTLTEIEQFYTDEPVQELREVEVDEPLLGMTAEENMTDAEWEAEQKERPIPQDSGWKAVVDSIDAVRKRYADQADKDFRAHLTELILDIMGESQGTEVSSL